MRTYNQQAPLLVLSAALARASAFLLSLGSLLGLLAGLLLDQLRDGDQPRLEAEIGGMGLGFGV